MIEKFQKEIEQYLLSNNIDNASKRILDYTWHYGRNTDTYQKSLALREQYNLQKSLGQRELDEEHIEEYKSLVKELVAEIQQFPIPTNSIESLDLIKVNGLKKTFSHKSKSFTFGPVSMNIEKGDIIGVVGENGNGKTTFLRLLQEEISKDEGELIFHYNLYDIAASDEYKRKNRTAFIPQSIPKWRGTLMENLTFFAAIHGFKGEKNIEIVQYVIHRMGLSAFTDLSWNQISTGYKLRFELAKMLVWEPSILILDEPLANLDIQATQNLLDDLQFFAKAQSRPIGILLTSQQLHEVEQIADKLLFLKNGAPVFSGLKKDFESSREEGILEFTLQKDHPELAQKLLRLEGVISVDLNTKINRIHYAKNYSSTDILRRLLDNGLHPTYFRDITNSTIQLFND